MRDTNAQFPTLQAHFEQVASGRPDAVAVAGAGEPLSYRELDARANGLARVLRARGIAPGAPVGVCLQPTSALPVCFWGVLKAGAVYVPIDPGYPRERIAMLARDAGVALLLTDAATLPNLPADLNPVPLPVDTLVTARDPLDDEASPGREQSAQSGELRATVGPTDLAYIIYTSGSTGAPKGVMVEHGAACNLGVTQLDYYGIRPDDRILQLASASFDVSISELLMAHLSGAALHVQGAGAVRVGVELFERLAAWRITTCSLTPSVLATLPRSPLPDLRTLVVGGEACAHELAEHWSTGRALYIAYGPTETTVCASVLPYERGRGGAPLGRATPGVSLYVLDDDRRPRPVDEPGELYIGGAGVARGYLNRPDLTEQRFVTDPFAADRPGASPSPDAPRMYRTGDRAVLRADGVIDFLGRVDDQIKVGGVRLEPGEIESVLRAHPGVADAAVAARAARGQPQKRLVAYVVAKPGVRVTGVELRAWAADRLPAVAVPSLYDVLPSLPKTPSGKIDRAALPEPRKRVATGLGARPSTPTEHLLAEIFADVLGVTGVRREDHFFELGGDSLLASQVVARVRSILCCEIAIAQMFAAPTVRLLAAVVGNDAPETRLVPPKKTPRQPGGYPLSFSEERTLFMEELSPNAQAYTAQSLITLTGALRPDLLERALTEIVRRHEIYRTSYPNDGGRRRAEIAEPWPVHVERIDLGQLPPDARRPELERRVAAAVAQRIDPTRLPLARWQLFRLTDTEHELLHHEHHLVHDGWSSNVFLAELVELYRDYLEGDTPSIPELPIQWIDFVRWQRAFVDSPAARRQLEYWRRHLESCKPLIDLPTDRPRPAVKSYRGDKLRIDIPPALAAGLRQASQRLGATLFMTTFAGFAAVLRRWSGADDVNIGTTVANRRWAETERIMGMMVNTIVIRLNLDGDPTFRELVARVREQVWAGFANQDVPIERIVDELRPQRSASHDPLFQVAWNFHEARGPDAIIPGLDVVMQEALSNRTAKFDLAVVVISRGRRDPRLTMVWEYSSDLWDEATMRRMIDQLFVLWEHAVQSPETRISELPLLTADEARTLAGFAGHAGDGDPRPVHVQIAERARLQPDAVAITCGTERLTYAELERRAGGVAVELIERGVRTDTVVGVCLPRSTDLIVACLGVMKAGGAYLPLDPAWPRPRLAHLVERARLETLIGLPAMWEGAGEELPAGVSVIGVAGAGAGAGSLGARYAGAERELWADYSQNSGPNDLAYVIFTSGSTGTPKGAMNEHRNLATLCAWQRRALALGPEDRGSHLSALSFDATVLETWALLTAGGSVHLAPEEARLDVVALRKWIVAQGITVAFMTTRLAAMFLADEEGPCGALRCLMTGGEALSRAAARPLPYRVMNLYGPAECAVCVTGGAVEASSDGRAPSIGRPIDGTTIEVVDEKGQLVPLGVRGEIVIVGRSVGRGYLHDDALTRERFLAEPDGPRRYRTGDIGRWRATGELEFVGRRDDQVKVRGMRVEPPEIEATLARCPGVGAVVVVPRRRGEETELVAYVEAGAEQSAANVRAFAQANLPAYMVPARFVALAKLPLTAHGKVDRSALPEPIEQRDAPASAPPATPLERAIADLWQELLRIDEVGVEDSFFELGGHSLLAMTMIARVRGQFAVELSIRDFYAAPTIRSLCESIAAAPAASEIRTSAATAAPLAFAQERWWGLHFAEPQQPLANVALAWDLYGRVSGRALELALRGIVARHEPLRTRFSMAHGVPVQASEPAPEHALVETIDACELAEDDVDRLTREHAARRFAIADEPPIRAQLVRLEPERHRLLLQVHHLAFDGLSLGLLWLELRSAYVAYLGNRTPEFPALPIQYRDFANWDRQQADQPERVAGVEWWQARLAGAPAFRYDAADAMVGRWFPARSLEHRLPAAPVERLRALCREVGVPFFAGCLSVFQLLLRELGGQDDFVVVSPSAGRTRHEVQALIGCFANTVAFRSSLPQLDGAADFRALLARVGADSLAALAHQEVPFESYAPAAWREPVFELLPPEPEWVLGDLEVARVAVAPQVSGVPLRWAIGEGPSESAGGARLVATYATNGFSDALIADLARRYEELLAEHTERPEGAIRGAGRDGRRDVFGKFRSQASPLLARASVPRAIEDWSRAIGAERVATDARSIFPYTINTSELRERRVPAVLRPQSRADVEAIVAVANRHGVPLYPFSTGKNWGLGSRLPVVDDCVLVDLGDMRVIRTVDARMRHAVIEPGVTQRQLVDHLRDAGLPLMLNVTGSAPDTSIVGNLLEKGTGFQRQRPDDLRGLEVVLGRGAVVRTGDWDATPAHYYRWGLGPSVDGMFLQSNFGIVTAAAIGLLPRDEVVMWWARVGADALAPALEALSRAYADGLVRSVSHVYNQERLATFGRAASEWLAVGSIAGRGRWVTAAIGELEERLQVVAQRVGHCATEDEADDAMLASLWRAHAGQVSDAFSAGMRMYPSDQGPDIDRWRTGMVSCLPILPFEPARVLRAVALAQEVGAELGLAPAISLNPLDGLAIEAVINFYFDRQSREATHRVHRASHELHERLARQGFQFQRLDVEGMFTRLDPATMETAARLKEALDPNHIIAPRRYNVV